MLCENVLLHWMKIENNESEKLKIGCLFVYRLELRTGIYYVFESRQEGKRLPVYKVTSLMHIFDITISSLKKQS